MRFNTRRCLRAHAARPTSHTCTPAALPRLPHPPAVVSPATGVAWGRMLGAPCTNMAGGRVQRSWPSSRESSAAPLTAERSNRLVGCWVVRAEAHAAAEGAGPPPAGVVPLSAHGGAFRPRAGRSCAARGCVWQLPGSCLLACRCWWPHRRAVPAAQAARSHQAAAPVAVSSAQQQLWAGEWVGRGWKNSLAGMAAGSSSCGWGTVRGGLPATRQ